MTNVSIAWASIDTVLLDMDGTLLDLRFDNFFWLEFLPAKYAQARGMTAQQASSELVPRFAARQGTLQWYCTDFWTRELGLDIAALKHEIRAQVCFLPGAEEFLQQMRQLGKRLVLLTNAHQNSLRVKCAATGLDRYFDALVSSHAVGHPKEHGPFWPAVQLQQRIDFTRSLFVDDSLAVLRAARTQGIAHLYAISKPDSTLPKRDIGEFPSVESVLHLMA